MVQLTKLASNEYPHVTRQFNILEPQENNNNYSSMGQMQVSFNRQQMTTWAVLNFTAHWLRTNKFEPHSNGLELYIIK